MLVLGVDDRDIGDPNVMCFESLERGKFGAISGEYLISASGCAVPTVVEDAFFCKCPNKQIVGDILVTQCQDGAIPKYFGVYFYDIAYFSATKSYRFWSGSVWGMATLSRFLSGELPNHREGWESHLFKSFPVLEKNSVEMLGYFNAQDALGLLESSFPDAYQRNKVELTRNIEYAALGTGKIALIQQKWTVG